MNIFLTNFKCLNNNVLVEIVGAYDTNVKLGDTTIEVSRAFEPEKFIATTGIVRAVPDHLTFGKRDHDLAWETTMQLQLNDRVIMSFMGVASAIGRNNKTIQEGGKLYAFVNYRDMVMAIRSGEEIMLNGYCKVEPLYKSEEPGQQHPGFIVSTKAVALAVSKNCGKIVQVGEPNRRYTVEEQSDMEVKKGDIIVYHPSAGIPMYKNTDDFMKGKYFFKIQRRYMLCVLE